MHRSLFLLPTALLLLLSFTARSVAQDEGRRRQGPQFGGGGFNAMLQMDKATLLASPQVREELKIKEEQAKKVDDILASHRQESQGLFQGQFGRDLSREERETSRRELTEKTAELRKKTAKKLEAVLEKEQAKRLNEIEIQQQGADALASEHVIAALKLEKEQVEKIRGTLASRDEELAKLRGQGGIGRQGGQGRRPGGDGGESFQEIREKSEKLRKDAEEKVLAFLTSEQKEGLTKLKGKPFELDRRRLLPGREGGRQGGPGGGQREGGERRRPPVEEV
jgi:hypothetical protein